MWNPTARAEHSRAHLRYGSDLTDAEWRLIEPYLPPPRHRGRRRRWSMREVIEAIFYVLRSGCPWRLLPDSFPPFHQLSPFRGLQITLTLRQHLTDLVAAYNFARRLKTLRGLTTYEAICKASTEQPARLMANPHRQSLGPNI